MDNLISIYEAAVSAYTAPGLLLMAMVLALAGVQAWYWMGTYARIHSFRNAGREAAGEQNPAISVVVVVRDEGWYINEVLPLVLTQQYDNFEVVAVDMSQEQENSEALAMLQHAYPHLHVTRLVQQRQRSAITNKMALNVGIKAAAYRNVLLTTTQVRPISQKWLALMAKGFANGRVVIGYCAIDRKPGLQNSLMRAQRLDDAMRYLSSAIRGNTYRGTRHNIGYDSGLYFDARGFDHLNMEAGEDDLFIQRIATRENTSIVMNPNAAVVQLYWGNFADRFRRRVTESTSLRYYPQWARNYISWETGSRALFFAAALTLILCMPWEIAAAAGGLILLRMGLVCFCIWRVARRLGEKRIVTPYILYDLFSPLYDGAVWMRRLKRR